ncbi:MAG: methylated-DNA--[protein]-cysteine S-methyltransferase [Peptoniphilaceae bacterium]|nr:methylated-DNA--[protein]-cysteine S-methyltransferase [Peptoniphilaceae bacterium]MDY6018701.1 methylated-DNA--[protein]-cysteine S-methyltransferase [Anaerococcus sp.]
MKYINKFSSPLGQITMASDGKNLTGLWFDGQKYDRLGLDKDYQEKNLDIFVITKRWLDIYFKGQNPDFKPQIKLYTTDFRKEVYSILEKIPYGQTTTYTKIAQCLSNNKERKKVFARPVGGALGHNPISIIIPCHRVLGKDRSLTGYAGGMERKIKLLELENISINKSK